MENYLAVRDQITVVRAGLFPTLSAGAGFTHYKQSGNKPLAAPGAHGSYNDLTIGGQASWEPDLWGKIRRQVESARESTQASAADLANVDLLLHSELASDYFQLRGLDSQTQVLKQTVADLEHQLDL